MAQQLQQPQSQVEPQSQYQQPSVAAGTQPAFQQPQLQQQPQSQQFGMGISQAVGQRYQESVPMEVQRAVQDLDHVSTVAEWAKNRASERGMPRVVRICDDIEDLAHLEKKLIIRQSPFAQPVGQAVQQTIQQGLQELQQHLNEPEVQETISQAQRSLDSVQKGLNSLQAFGQQQQLGTGFQEMQATGQQVGQAYQQPTGTVQQY